MGESVKLIRGWMSNGIIIPEPGTAIPDGAEVRMELVPEEQQCPIPFTPEERAEFDAWNRLSAKAWKWIDDMEQQESANDAR